MRAAPKGRPFRYRGLPITLIAFQPGSRICSGTGPPPGGAARYQRKEHDTRTHALSFAIYAVLAVLTVKYLHMHEGAAIGGMVGYAAAP